MAVPETFVKDGGVWKASKEIFIRDGGVWKDAKIVFVKDGGVWKIAHATVEEVSINADVDVWDAVEQGVTTDQPILLDLSIAAGVVVGNNTLRDGHQHSLNFDGLHVDSMIRLTVGAGAYVTGRGGNGGLSEAIGGTGFHAIYCRNPIWITNEGTIQGGGGGGGGGGRGTTQTSYSCNCQTTESGTTCDTCWNTHYHDGGPGGGGAGSAGGDGQVAGGESDPGTIGAGGAGGTATDPSAGDGGDGGAPGQPGNAGANGNYSNGGAGGAAGYWIDGYSYVQSLSGAGSTLGPSAN